MIENVVKNQMTLTPRLFVFTYLYTYTKRKSAILYFVNFQRVCSMYKIVNSFNGVRNSLKS